MLEPRKYIWVTSPAMKRKKGKMQNYLTMMCWERGWQLMVKKNDGCSWDSRRTDRTRSVEQPWQVDISWSIKPANAVWIGLLFFESKCRSSVNCVCELASFGLYVFIKRDIRSGFMLLHLFRCCRVALSFLQIFLLYPGSYVLIVLRHGCISL